MAKKIGEYLKSKDVHFVVVGAAHLVGETGSSSCSRSRASRSSSRDAVDAL
jgi:uncharacterized protein YbaP (TraB family)